MSFDRSETTVELSTIVFNATDPAQAGLSATYDPQANVITIGFASIEGSSSLVLPGGMLPGLIELATALTADVPPPPDDTQPTE